MQMPVLQNDTVFLVCQPHGMYTITLKKVSNIGIFYVADGH